MAVDASSSFEATIQSKAGRIATATHHTTLSPGIQLGWEGYAAQGLVVLMLDGVNHLCPDIVGTPGRWSRRRPAL